MRRIEKQISKGRGQMSETGGQRTEIRGQGKLQEDKKFGR
jgi:hypothetical protein